MRRRPVNIAFALDVAFALEVLRLGGVARRRSGVVEGARLGGRSPGCGRLREGRDGDEPRVRPQLEGLGLDADPARTVPRAGRLQPLAEETLLRAGLAEPGGGLTGP
jgi:hypothetical protein